MFILSGGPSSISHMDILHLSVLIFGMSSWYLIYAYIYFKIWRNFTRNATLDCLHLMTEMIENYYPSNTSDEESADSHKAWGEEKTNGPLHPAPHLSRLSWTPRVILRALTLGKSSEPEIAVKKTMRRPSTPPPPALRYGLLPLSYPQAYHPSYIDAMNAMNDTYNTIK